MDVKDYFRASLALPPGRLQTPYRPRRPWRMGLRRHGAVDQLRPRPSILAGVAPAPLAPRLKLELITRAVAADPRDRGHALPPRVKAAIGRTAHPAAIVGAPWSGLRPARGERQSGERDQCNRDGAHDGDLLLARRIRPTVICRLAWLKLATLEYLRIAGWRVAAGLGFSCLAGLSTHRLVSLSLLIGVGQRLALRLRRLFRLLSDGWAPSSRASRMVPGMTARCITLSSLWSPQYLNGDRSVRFRL
jgi:hypothetical protein